MNIWVINPYGNLPEENWRPHRSYMVSRAFSQKGYNVTYWISNFDHRSKFERKDITYFNTKINIKIIPSTKYSNHISLNRIKFEINFIKNLIKVAEKEINKPDLIIIGEPALFISFNLIKFTNKYKVPFIIDMVDIWPELFKISLPVYLRKFDKIIFSPFYLKRKWFIKKAIGIVSVSNAYLEIAKKINKSNFYKCIYWGVDLNSFKEVKSNNLGFKKNKDEIWLIYAGTLGDNYDTKSIIEIGKKIENTSKNFKLFIAGDGNLKEYVVNSISKHMLNKTKYLGRLKPEELVGFYKNCDIALSTYAKHSSVSMPIKAFDYFAAGLPMINSLGMDLGEMIESNKIGVNYEPGDCEDLFAKLMILTKNPDLLKKMNRNTKEFSRNFNEKDLYDEYVLFCENILNNI